VIKGGTSKNTVPGEAECILDLRFESVSDAQGLVTELEHAARTAASSVPGGGEVGIEGGLLLI